MRFLIVFALAGFASFTAHAQSADPNRSGASADSSAEGHSADCKLGNASCQKNQVQRTLTRPAPAQVDASVKKYLKVDGPTETPTGSGAEEAK